MRMWGRYGLPSSSNTPLQYHYISQPHPHPLHHHTTHPHHQTLSIITQHTHTIKPSPSSHNTPPNPLIITQHTYAIKPSLPSSHNTPTPPPQVHTHKTTPTRPRPSPSMICAAAMKGSWQPSTDLAKELHTPMGMIPMRVWAVTGMKRDFLRLTPALFWVWRRRPFRSSLKRPSPPTAMRLGRRERVGEGRRDQKFFFRTASHCGEAVHN